MQFVDTVHKITSSQAGILNHCVDVPERLVTQLHQTAGRLTGPVPVRGSPRGSPFVTTIVKYQGTWRLYLNTRMRRAARVVLGDRVRVTLDYDPSPRKQSVPALFAAALAENEPAAAAFAGLAPSYQNELLRYLNNMRRQETLRRNIGKIVRYLEGKRVDGLHHLLR